MMMETLEIVRMIIGRLLSVGSGDRVTCVPESRNGTCSNLCVKYCWGRKLANNMCDERALAPHKTANRKGFL